MNETTVTLNVKGLDQLLKTLRKKPPTVRLGIIGNKNLRSGKNNPPTNAQVGAAHEFGTENIPQRSFLRIPLLDHLDKELEKSGALDKDTLNEIIRTGALIPYLKKVAVLAEGIVMGAFDTGGYGKWAAWKNPNYQNNTGDILVDTQQLRNSITSEVSE